jgi:aminoglycoside 3-N-acetyltransferase
MVRQTSLTREDIEEGLRLLGLGRGDAAEVHSSLSSFGHVVGGAPTVVDALMDIVGPDGALVMSAYPLTRALALTEEEKARGIAWKVRKLAEDSPERTGMGAIADEFCTRPGVICGTGIHRVCAWGRDALLHSRGYYHLLDIDGWALLLGVDITRCSSMHAAEQVGIPEPIARLTRVPEEIRKDYPVDTWVVGYGSTPDDAWAKVWEQAESQGLIRKRRIGRAQCMLFRAKAVVSIYADRLRTDPFELFGVKQGRG